MPKQSISSGKKFNDILVLKYYKGDYPIVNNELNIKVLTDVLFIQMFLREK